MSLEREVKLAAPAGFRLPELSVGGVMARQAEPQHYATVYVDTPDLRLVRWECSLRHRQGEGWTLKLPVDASGGVLSRRELRFAGDSEEPPAAAVDLVQALVRTSTLSPVARLQTHRSVVDLGAADGRRLATLTDDRVSVMDGSHVAWFRELELELAPDAPLAILAPLVAELRGAGAGPVDNTPKLVRVLGPRAREPEVAIPELGPDPTVGDVVRRSLALSVVRLFRHDPGVRIGADPGDVHQARVATRRLRSDLRSFRAELDPSWSTPLAGELRWLGRELGAVRDAEVLRDRLRAHSTALPERDRGGAERLVARMDTARIEARHRLRVALRQPRYLALLDHLVEAAHSPGVLQGTASLPAERTLRRVVTGPWSRLRVAIERVTADPNDDVLLHAARIRAKRVRYAAEAVAPAFGEVAQAFATAAARLQEILGEHQDAVVAAAWLRTMASSSDPAISFTAGTLAVLEENAAAAARAAWPRAWKTLAGNRLRFFE